MSRPGMLARGPWRPDQLEVRWLERAYEPPAELQRRADEQVDGLRERGSPCHDGMAARLASFEAGNGALALELQPCRWALRLVEGEASDSLTALCAVRTEDGRWLAGRRAPWVSTWAGRWAIGAGGAVDLGESPVDTLPRELREEWRLEPQRLSVEALIRLPNGVAMLVGLATVNDSSDPVPDAEHDDWEWWHPDPDRWPEHAEERVRLMGRFLAGEG